MKDTAIVSTLNGYAVAWDGVLDEHRFDTRQDAKRHLQELYTHPQMRPHKLKVVDTTTKDK
jgi:hypothetical protein